MDEPPESSLTTARTDDVDEADAGINAQMRTIAVALTPREIEQLAAWFAAQR